MHDLHVVLFFDVQASLSGSSDVTALMTDGDFESSSAPLFLLVGGQPMSCSGRNSAAALRSDAHTTDDESRSPPVEAAPNTDSHTADADYRQMILSLKSRAAAAFKGDNHTTDVYSRGFRPVEEV